MRKSSNRNKAITVVKDVTSASESEEDVPLVKSRKPIKTTPKKTGSVKKTAKNRDKEGEKEEEFEVEQDVDKALVKKGKPMKKIPKKTGSVKKTLKNPDKEEDEEELEVEDDGEPLVKKGKSIKKTSKKTGSEEKTSKNLYEEEDAQEEEEEEEFEVEQIIAHKFQRNEFLYRIRWKNYESGDDTWEPEATLSCPDIIKKYKDANPDTAKPIAKKRGSNGKKSHSKAKTSKVAVDETIDSDEPECDGKEWEVQKIVDVHYNRNGSREFLIRWAGYRPSDDTWEPEKHLECTDLIGKFMSKIEESKNANQKELRTQPKHTDRFILMGQSKDRRLSRRHDGRQRAVYYDAE